MGSDEAERPSVFGQKFPEGSGAAIERDDRLTRRRSIVIQQIHVGAKNVARRRIRDQFHHPLRKARQDDVIVAYDMDVGCRTSDYRAVHVAIDAYIGLVDLVSDVWVDLLPLRDNFDISVVAGIVRYIHRCAQGARLFDYAIQREIQKLGPAIRRDGKS